MSRDGFYDGDDFHDEVSQAASVMSRAAKAALTAEIAALRAERDTLTAENAELKRLMQLETLADVELRSLRAAVAQAEQDWAKDTYDSACRYMQRLVDLVPTDGSWLEEGKQ